MYTNTFLLSSECCPFISFKLLFLPNFYFFLELQKSLWPTPRLEQGNLKANLLTILHFCYTYILFHSPPFLSLHNFVEYVTLK